MKRAVGSLLLLVLLLAPVAVAQITTGTLTGTVSSEGSALPGVTVTISSPSLQGTRSTETGEAGGYHFPALPPGEYRIVCVIDGFQRTEKRVVVNVAQTSRADVELRVSAISESVTVTAAAPAAVETIEVATNFQVQQVNELPMGRTIDDIVLLSPGVTEGGPNDQIVISGSHSFDSLFLVDGVVVNENLRGQPHALYIEDAVQESTILTGGVSAEFGRFTGGVVSTVTKSGGNDFTGSLRDSLTNPNWTSKTDYAAQTDPIDDLNSSYEGTLGGRILRDRLWFFAAGRYQEREESKQTTQTNIPYVFTSEDERMEGKLTGQITTRHSLVGSYIKSDESRGNFVTSGRVVDLRSLTTYERPKSLMSWHYSGIITNNLLIEGLYSRMNDKFTGGAETRDLIQGTMLLDVVTGNRMWSPTFCGSPCPPKQRDNKSWLGKGSYFLSTRALGNHSIVGGVEEFHQLRNENNYQSGSDFRIHGDIKYINNQFYFGVDPDTAQIEWDPVPALSATSDFAVRSYFINDKIDLTPRWSFNAGVRYDKAFGTDQAGRKTVDDSGISPRLAATFDPKGDGRHRFGATYGRYVSKVDQGPADNTATAGRYASYYWNYKGPAINPPGTPTNQLLPIEEVIKQVFNWFNSVGGTKNVDPNILDSVRIPGVTTRFDKSLTAPYMDEWTAGYAMTLGTKGYVRADYVDRKWSDFYVVRRTIATGKAVDPNGNRFDQGVIENSSEGLERKYQGVQLQGSFRPFNALSIGGNYTWSKLRGNVEGETASGATALTDFQNRPEYSGFYRNNPVGYLGPDMRHRANLWVQYNLLTPVGRLNFSLLERYHSPLSYSASGLIDVRANSATGPADGVVNPGYVTVPSSVTYFFSERGAFRTDAISATDFGFNWYFPSIRGVSFFVETDVINLFNQQGIEDPDFIDKTILARRNATCIQSNSTARCLAFNPFKDTPVEGTHWRKGVNFGKPTQSDAYQLPRTYRASIGLRF